jgi:hypothetical protein
MASFIGACAGAAGATGTVRIQQADGSAKVYQGVRIVIANKSMTLTSPDGKGTLTISKAACTSIGQMFRCLPYAATLAQNGKTLQIGLQSGTVWINPSTSIQQLPQSSTTVQSQGVLMSLETKSGTYVSLSGIADVLSK